MAAACAGSTGPTLPTPGPTDGPQNEGPPTPPNIVLIVADDLGYGDLSSYGGPMHTPHIDALAAGGARFTDFYVPSPICAPTRAAVMTGRYGPRVGIDWCYDPQQSLPSDELTIAEELRGRGYATALFGKWHLGEAAADMPVHHGFDTAFGMVRDKGDFYDGDAPAADVALEHLSKTYLDRAGAFVAANAHRPFLLVLTHRLPHLPSIPAAEFRGRTGSDYGDTVLELDWFVGQVAELLRVHQLADKTLTFFMSDNGPIGPEAHGGSSAPFRGRKQQVYEGGIRVPAIAHWPGHIPAGRVITAPAIAVDLFPTLLGLAGGALASDRTYDGVDVWPLLTGAAEELEERDLVFWMYAQPTALRRGRWKLHRGWIGQAGGLYDLATDPGETVDRAASEPDVAAALDAGLTAATLGR